MAERTHETRIATLEERTAHLVTRGDLYRALLIQTLAIAAVVGGMLQLAG